MEKALIRHIQDALEDKHIEALVDQCTNLLTGHAPTMLDYLSYNYGKVRFEDVTQKDNEVMTMTWQPNDPIILLTRPVEQLQKLATQAGMPCTGRQTLEKGLTLTRATRDFEHALTQWEEKPQHQKTWPNFKTHFHEAQLQLKRIRGPAMHQAGQYHANILAQDLSTQIQHQLQRRDEQLFISYPNYAIFSRCIIIL